jgi:hypothetical protein
MSKEDEDEDPMAFLNKMRAKVDTLTLNQDAGNEALIAASNAKESMERIESLLTSREDEEDRKSRNQPPPGLSAEEEQEWWTARIAFLSKPVSENYTDSSPSADCKAYYDDGRAAKKSSKESDAGHKPSSKTSRK